MKDATVHDTTDGIAADCNSILAFLQAVALKEPQVQAAPLSLREDKRVMGWFRQWADSNLKRQEPCNKAAPQDHSGLTGFLIEVDTWLQTVEAFRPVVVEKREADRETRG